MRRHRINTLFRRDTLAAASSFREDMNFGRIKNGEKEKRAHDANHRPENVTTARQRVNFNRVLPPLPSRLFRNENVRDFFVGTFNVIAF